MPEHAARRGEDRDAVLHLRLRLLLLLLILGVRGDVGKLLIVGVGVGVGKVARNLAPVAAQTASARPARAARGQFCVHMRWLPLLSAFAFSGVDTGTDEGDMDADGCKGVISGVLDVACRSRLLMSRAYTLQ